MTLRGKLVRYLADLVGQVQHHRSATDRVEPNG